MGTRITRHRQLAPGPHDPQLQQLVGQMVEVLLHNGRTRSGRLVAVSEKGLSIRDLNARWYNLRKHTHTHTWAEVEEVTATTAANW